MKINNGIEIIGESPEDWDEEDDYDWPDEGEEEESIDCDGYEDEESDPIE